jgi:hypothetical protein
VRKLMSTPVTEVNTQKAKLRLGSGEWEGQVQLLMAGGVVRGKSTGRISKVDMSQFISAFTTATERVEGQLEIPQYSLRFGGANGDQIQKSLNGTGQLMVSKGRVKALDILGSIQRGAQKLGLVETQQSGSTEFTTLNSLVEIADGQIKASELALDGPALQLNGLGTITFDKDLNFKITTLVRGKVAELLGYKPVGTGPAEAQVPVEITGNLDNPRIVPNIKKMAVAAGTNYLKDMLQQKQPKLLEGLQQKQPKLLEGLQGILAPKKN